MPPIASDALVLRTYKLGETGKVVVLLTRERGKVRAVAKGVRGARPRYQSALAGCSLALPQVPEWAEPVWHLYVVRHPNRDALQQALADAGVGTLIHYPIPPHRQQAYADRGFKPGEFPIAEAMAEEVLSLPIGPHLSFEDQDRVIAALFDFTP